MSPGAEGFYLDQPHLTPGAFMKTLGQSHPCQALSSPRSSFLVFPAIWLPTLRATDIPQTLLQLPTQGEAGRKLPQNRDHISSCNEDGGWGTGVQELSAKDCTFSRHIVQRHQMGLFSHNWPSSHIHPLDDGVVGAPAGDQLPPGEDNRCQHGKHVNTSPLI